jgi:hypothetical protein
MVRFLIFSAAILLPAATVIIATKGRLGRARETVDAPAAVSDQTCSRCLDSAGQRLKIRYVSVTIFQLAALGDEDHRAGLVMSRINSEPALTELGSRSMTCW